MSKIIILFINTLFLQSVFAENPIEIKNRASSISLEHQIATDYKSSFGALNLGATKKLSLGLSLSKTEDNSEITKDRSVNVSYLVNSQFSARASFTNREEPAELVSNGISTGFNWTISEIWKNENQTTLSLDLGRTNYKQEGRVLLNNLTLEANREFTQSRFTLGIEQELNFYFSLGADYTKYEYNDKSFAELRTNAQNRVVQSNGFDGTSGLQDNSWSVFLLTYPFEWLDFEISYSESLALGESSPSKSSEARPTFYLGTNWSIGLIYSHLNSSTGTSDTYGLSTTYTF